MVGELSRMLFAQPDLSRPGFVENARSRAPSPAGRTGRPIGRRLRG